MRLRRYFNTLFAKLFAGFCLVILLTGAGVWLVAYTAQVRQANDVGIIEWRLSARKAVDTAVSVYQYGGRDALRRWLQDTNLNSHPTVFIMNADGEELSGRTVPAKAVAMLPEVKALASKPNSIMGNMPAAAVRTIEIEGRPWDVLAVRTSAGPIRIIPPNLYHFPIVLTLTLAFVFTLAVSWLLARLYTRNLSKLNSALRHFGEGEFGTRVAAKLASADTEVADLASVFDRCAIRIEELINRQRRLFHDVSHEIRSPLARIDVALELAKRSPEAADKQLERIQKEVNNIDSLVDNLLTYARLDSDTDMPTDPIGLADIVAEVAENLQFEAQKKNVTVAFSIGGDPVIEGNGTLLARAVENLTRNALRYSPDHSTITLSLVEESEHYAVICRDQGPGMSDEDIAVMFNPFVRGSNEATGSGFGLGLAIAKRAVKRHGGTISARNADPCGLELTVRIPKPDKPLVSD